MCLHVAMAGFPEQLVGSSKIEIIQNSCLFCVNNADTSRHKGTAYFVFLTLAIELE